MRGNFYHIFRIKNRNPYFFFAFFSLSSFIHPLFCIFCKALNMYKKWKAVKKCYIHISYIYIYAFINEIFFSSYYCIIIYFPSMQQLRQSGVKIVLDPLFFLLYFLLSHSLTLSTFYLLFSLYEIWLCT